MNKILKPTKNYMYKKITNIIHFMAEKDKMIGKQNWHRFLSAPSVKTIK